MRNLFLLIVFLGLTFLGMGQNMPVNRSVESQYSNTPVIHSVISKSKEKDNSSTIIISELCDPKNDYRKNRYIEITNVAGTYSETVDLEGWKLVAIGNGGAIFSWTLSGTIAPHQSITCGDTENSSFSPTFALDGWSDSNSTWNGSANAGGDGAKLLNASDEVIDDASAHGDFADKASIRLLAVKHPTTTFSATEWYAEKVDTPEESTPGSHICVWQGYFDGTSWSTPENWIHGYVPKSLSHAIVDYYISPEPSSLLVFSEDNPGIVCDITLGEGASLLGVNYLTVKGTATVQKDIYFYTDDTNGWHLISAPVHDMEITGSDFQPVPGQDDFYEYDNQNNMWLNYYDGMEQTGQFIPGKGYLVAYHQNNAEYKEFVGKLNTASSYQPEINGDKWHLIGNPYPSSIDWDYVECNAVGSPKRLNAATGEYKDVEIEYFGDDYVFPAMVYIGEGIFVYAEDDPDASVIIPVEAQASELLMDYKTTTSSSKVKLKAKFGENLDVSLTIGTEAQATQDYEWKYDARYLAPVTYIPNLAAVTNNQVQVSKYIFGEETHSVVIPLYFKVYDEQEITFNLEGDFGYTIVLEDKMLNKMIDISAETYTFMARASDDTERFVLHLSKNAIGVEENHQEVVNVNVYAYKQHLYIQADDDFTNGTVTVFNTLGQVVLSEKINQQSNVFELHNGVYIVTVKSNEGVVSKKLVIR